MHEQTVWKFKMSPVTTTIRMPTGARLLAAAHQDSEIVMWAMVDPAMPLVNRNIRVVSTGKSLPEVAHRPDKWRFVDTVIAWTLVFHIFDLGETLTGDIGP